jgi:hypothetical protein
MDDHLWIGNAMEAVFIKHSAEYSALVREKFNHLAAQWNVERGVTSNIVKMHLQPSYQRIIGLGPAALPFIFEEMSRKPDFWFWALRAITGENPVPADHAANIEAMTQDWLAWAREQEIWSAQSDRKGLSQAG